MDAQQKRLLRGIISDTLNRFEKRAGRILVDLHKSNNPEMYRLVNEIDAMIANLRAVESYLGRSK